MVNKNNIVTLPQIFYKNSMLSFIGNFEAKFDEKGRVFVPSAYRKMLPDGERSRLAMRRSADEKHIVLYPEGVWQRQLEALRERLDEWNPQDQMLLAQFVADAEWLDFDSQGRVLLGKKHLQAIEASGEVIFVGMIDRIAVWSKEVYEKSKFSSADFSKLLAEKMSKKTL